MAGLGWSATSAVSGALAKSAADAKSSEFSELDEYNLKDLPSFVAVRFVNMLERSSSEPVLNMTNLGITDHQMSTVADHVGRTQWTKIWLSYNKLTDAGFLRLIAALKERNATHQVEELSLASNRLSDASVLATVAAFEINRERNMLKVLDFAHNKKVSDASVEPLCRLLSGSKRLRKLSLTNTGVSDKGCKALFSAIRVSSLCELRLSSDLLTEACLDAVLDACRESCLGVCVITGPKLESSRRLAAIRQFLEVKGSRTIRILTALCSVFAVPRLANRSPLKSYPKELLPNLAVALFPLLPYAS